MNNRVWLFIVGMLVMLGTLAHTAGWVHIRLLDELENIAYDYRLRMTMPGGVDPRIVIIDIDENSLASQGQWPWRRDKLAEMTRILFDEYYVEVLGYDVVFAEPDVDHSLQKVQELASRMPLSQEISELLNLETRDRQFARVLQEYNVVLGYGFDHRVDASNAGELPPPIFHQDIAQRIDVPVASRYTANLPILQARAFGGFFSLLNNVDSDGIIRKASLLNEFEGELYESLALATARNYLGLPVDPLFLDPTQPDSPMIGIDFGISQLEMGERASVFVPFRGPQGSFRYIPAEDVLNREVENPDDLAGVVALVGTSAAGLVDLRATPMQNIYPGVEVHANIIAGLLDGEFRNQPDWARGAEIVLLIILGVLMSFLLPYLSALWMTVFTVIMGFGIAALNTYIWVKAGFVLPLANSLILVSFIYVFNVINGFFSETRSRRQLTSMFGLYVPPEIVDEMDDSSPEALLKSERKEMTILFTDVRNFTPIAEQLDPAELSELMNAFLTPLTRVVHDHRGAIDKYMGDAMMAFWGAPLDDPDHARHALQAAIEMVDRVDELNVEFKKRRWPEIGIGIGLGTGMVSVGNMGSEFRMAYTVLGDAVNLGSRLEGLTRIYGVNIVVGNATVEAIPDYEFRELDLVRVKGKTEPITIYEPIGRPEDIDEHIRAELEVFGRGLKHYREQQWAEAEATFDTLSSIHQDPVYELYLERIRFFRHAPPGVDWGGVFNYQTK